MSTRPELNVMSPRVAIKTDNIPPTSPRTISFATSPTRPPLLSDSEHIPTSFIWTGALEERLNHVQSELKKSQRRWSESQDIWLEEEHNLIELKKRFKKAQKADANARNIALTWKRKTFSRPNFRSSRKNSSASGFEEEDSFGEEDEEAEVSEIEGKKKSSRSNTGASISSAIRRLSVSVKSRNNSTTGSPTTPIGNGIASRPESRGAK